ncbi:hypothetical protein IIA16_02580, partial [bacterium]|nr:hypothetical protein [bacterium]
GDFNPLVYICHHCAEPTYFDTEGHQHPVAVKADMRPVPGLPDTVETLLEEAELCLAAGAPTACAMCCRKLLMNTAETKGASEEVLDYFGKCVGFLEDWLPGGGSVRLKAIRDIGTDANHEIWSIEPDLARECLAFTTEVLRYIYEWPMSEAEKEKWAKEKEAKRAKQKDQS